MNSFLNPMKIYLFVVYFSFFSLAFSQRGITGDKTFSSRFPEDKFNEISNASLEIVNEVDHDIIVVIRDQRKKYIRLLDKSKSFTRKQCNKK